VKSVSVPLSAKARKTRAWAAALGKARRLLEASLGRKAMRKVTRDDLRFQSLVRSLSATAPNLLVTVDGDSCRPRLTKKIGAIAQQLCEEIQAARRLTLSEEITAILNARSDNSGVILRLGLLDGEPMTLQEAGEIMGVTRERVRQKEAKLEVAISKGKPYTPVLEKTLLALGEIVGTDVSQLSDVESALRSSGVLTQSERACQILRFGNLVGSCKYEITSFNGIDVIARTEVLRDFAAFRDRVRDTLDTMTRDFGAVPFEGLQDALEQGTVAPHSAKRILFALKTWGDEVEWLETNEWLRLRRGWSRIRNFAIKVLSVSPSMRVSDLRRGLQRHHRIRHVPQSRILGKMLASDLHDIGASFDGTWLTVANPPDPLLTLSSVDLIVYEVLRANGGVMARAALEAATKAKGMPGGTFHVAIGYSPVFDRIMKGVYAIRGVAVAPGLAESLLKSTERPTALARDYGHLTDGRVYLSQEMSQFAVDHAMLGRPVGIKDYVADSNYSINVDGQSHLMKFVVLQVKFDFRRMR